MEKYLLVNLKESDIDTLFKEMKNFVDSWGKFEDLKSIEDKVYQQLFFAFYETAKSKKSIVCTYPEAHAVYRILKILLQQESNDVFQAFADKKGLSVINGAWCYTETNQEFDFETEEQPEKSKKEKMFLFFLTEFQNYLIK